MEGSESSSKCKILKKTHGYDGQRYILTLSVENYLLIVIIHINIYYYFIYKLFVPFKKKQLINKYHTTYNL